MTSYHDVADFLVADAAQENYSALTGWGVYELLGERV